MPEKKSIRTTSIREGKRLRAENAALRLKVEELTDRYGALRAEFDRLAESHSRLIAWIAEPEIPIASIKGDWPLPEAPATLPSYTPAEPAEGGDGSSFAMGRPKGFGMRPVRPPYGLSEHLNAGIREHWEREYRQEPEGESHDDETNSKD